MSMIFNVKLGVDDVNFLDITMDWKFGSNKQFLYTDLGYVNSKKFYKGP